MQTSANSNPTSSLPRFIQVKQNFEPSATVDIDLAVDQELACLTNVLPKNSRIAVGVGSRGITNLKEIVAAVLRKLQSLGSRPFIIPAMGSHGGATSEGQLEVLESYGITETSMGVPIHASMDVRQIGATEEGVPVHCSTEALNADAILLINRIKPHTDFFGDLGSGLIKMCVIGLGKRIGAETMHLAATQFGYERIIKSLARKIVEHTKVIGGLAIIENQHHQTASLQYVDKHDFERCEAELLRKAKQLMPLLPFDEIDLLIVDAIGKNISGAGMDPNVINRSIHGYNSLPIRMEQVRPFIRRIFVRGLTRETHGNAIGIGMADATTLRLVQQTDMNKTAINSLTALTPQSAKIPIAFESDRSAIAAMLKSLPIADWSQARIVRIADTLSVACMQISESLWDEVRATRSIEPIGELEALRFDHENLVED